MNIYGSSSGRTSGFGPDNLGPNPRPESIITMQITLALTGSALKEQGQAIALSHAGENWTHRTLAALRVYCALRKERGDTKFLLEDFRESRSHDMPPSPNCWGGIPRLAIKAGIIRWTGEYKPAKSLKTHAHPVREYEAI